MKNMMTEVEVLRYLGQRCGTHWERVKFSLSVGASQPQVPGVVHDDHLHVEDDGIWKRGSEDNFLMELPPQVVAPLLDDFIRVVK